ncbi:PTS sugar transporter subunit IIA [Aureliella helgolandensis]|uniref:PTS system mannose-specific EIIBCA component n=1 Tax=Aureliella helgolandensis TaxID=2527968 RepID=A0A518GEL9_9BACT|nr:PTS sugar transporter subunit IIA [Aureliella helgolandensis]QDV27045.1 PTS system mannose-specific EIIBCA component [Aureliella helgolandensis]
MASKDLDIEQLAAYLHLIPQQVQRMADRGKLPGRKLGGAWKFSEAEVHSWLEERIGASDNEELTQVQKVVDRWSNDKKEVISLHQLLHPEAIETPLAARTRSSVVRRMSALAERTGYLWDAAQMVDAVLAREELHPTALDNGVALLHPRRPQSSILAEPLLALGVSSQPLPFGNQSGHLTDVFFLICSTDDHVHLQVLAKLSRLLSGTGFLEELRRCDSAAEAHQLLKQHEEAMDDAE